MRRDLKLRNSERGYMLITLALAMALIAIALLTVLPEIGQRIKRDREDELRHRGTSYMRAIQHFYKKFGRYPTRPEELENTNNIRFIRKLYKDPENRDPVTGKEKDFKFLHQQDISLNSGLLGQIPGQGMMLPGQGGQPGQGGAGGPNGVQSALSGMAAQVGGMMQQAANPGGQATLNDDSGKPSTGASGGSSSGSNSPFSGPTFGGGPIIGVASASTSKEKTIHVFNDKDHFKDWLFIYVPGQERGGLIVGPVQPGLPTNGNLNGMVPGMGGSMPGQPPGLGQGLGGGLNQPQSPVAPSQPSPTPPPPEQ